MKLISWNVNGIRAAAKKGLFEFIQGSQADVFCLQEIKAKPEQLDEAMLHPKGFESYWMPAEKPGYSGTAIYSKKEPLHIEYGMGQKEYDSEGRTITAEYPDFYLVNGYFPNSQRERARLDYKIGFCDSLLKYCKKLKKKGKPVVVCGDYNIAHKEIDLKNPKTNQDNAGFLPEEREWMSKFLKSGFTDTFRHFCEEPDHYTWWSYRAGVRARNIGWRIDYFCSDGEMDDRLKSSIHHPKIMGSDHCPIELNLK